MDDADIERDLTQAQAAVEAAKNAPRQRRAAVVRAREAGWSKYRIAATLGVKGPTVDAIISAADRDKPEPA